MNFSWFCLSKGVNLACQILISNSILHVQCDRVYVSDEDTDEESDDEYDFKSDGEGVLQGNGEEKIQN